MYFDEKYYYPDKESICSLLHDIRELQKDIDVLERELDELAP